MRRRAAVAGMAAAGVALAVAEIVAGLVPRAPSLVVSVGAAIIDHVPSAVKDFAVAVFGLYDKLPLNLGIAVIALLIGALLGVVALGRPVVVGVAFSAFGLLGFLAALDQPGASPLWAAFSAGASVVAGLLTLRGMLLSAAVGWGLQPPLRPPSGPEPISGGPRPAAPTAPADPVTSGGMAGTSPRGEVVAEGPAGRDVDEGRRRFIGLTVGAFAAAAVSAG
ncbi:MAG: molybdopterin-binding oxidoreductase, partial [Actinomycetota bacterium]|nr:molybdopterin-binding oxidoreductase [Actinomycetota bacterium]